MPALTQHLPNPRPNLIEPSRHVSRTQILSPLARTRAWRAAIQDLLVGHSPWSQTLSNPPHHLSLTILSLQTTFHDFVVILTGQERIMRISSVT